MEFSIGHRNLAVLSVTKSFCRTGFIIGTNMRHYCNRGNIDIEFHVL